MTVKELIQKLSLYEDDLEVLIDPTVNSTGYQRPYEVEEINGICFIDTRE